MTYNIQDKYFLTAAQVREVLTDREWHSNAIQSIAVEFDHGAKRWRIDDLCDLWPELNPAPALGADWLTRFKRRAALDAAQPSQPEDRFLSVKKKAGKTGAAGAAA